MTIHEPAVDHHLVHTAPTHNSERAMIVMLGAFFALLIGIVVVAVIAL